MSIMAIKMMNDNTKYGTALEMIIIIGFIGETNNTSIVPRSFSFTMLTEVIMAQISMSNIPIIPGTKLNALLICGLYKFLVEATEMADFQSQFQWFLGFAFALLFLDVFLLERKTKWLEKLNLFNEKK